MAGFKLIAEEDIVAPPSPTSAVVLPQTPNGKFRLVQDDALSAPDASIDERMGAPASVRAVVGSARTPEDRLATLRQYYPDAQPVDDDNFVFTDPKTKRQVRYNPKGMDIGDVASVGGEMSEMAGGVLGGAAAAVPALAAAVPTGGASLLGIPAGIGLGAAGGRELFDVAARNMGTVDTRELPTRLADTAVTAGTNAIGARAGDLVAQGGRRVIGAMERYSPGLTSGQAAIDDARRIAVDPTVGTVTGNRGMQIVENALSNTPGGAGVMQESAERAMRQMDEAAGRIATDLAGGGRPQSQQGAGTVIKNAAKGAATRFSDRRLQLDEALAQEIGPATMVSAPNVRQFVMKLEADIANAPESRRPVLQKALDRANSILADIAPKRDPATGQVISGAGIPFKSLRQIRTDIGGDLERPDVSGYTPAAERALRELYGAVRADIQQAAETAGPRAKQLLNIHDRYVRFNANVNLPTLQKIEDAGTDEQAFNFAMNAAKDGGSMLGNLRRSFKPEEWDVVASSVFSKMGRANPGQQEASAIGEAADDFSANTFLTNWSKLSPEAKKELFGGKRYADLAPEIEALVRTAGRFKDAGKMSNPSGTARNTIAALTVLGAGDQLLRDGDPKGAAGTVATAVLAPRAVAKLMTSPKFVNWLGNTVTATANKPAVWPMRIGQLTAIAEVEPEIRGEVYQYLDALRSVGGE